MTKQPSFQPRIVCAALALFLLSSCASYTKESNFSPRTCIETVPERVEGLLVQKGARSDESIRRDMQLAYCNGQMLLRAMNERGEQVDGGTVLVKARVEYTGEVIAAEIIDTDIQSERFLRRIADFVMDTDFTSWQRSDEDSEFIYPLRFDHWWKE